MQNPAFMPPQNPAMAAAQSMTPQGMSPMAGATGTPAGVQQPGMFANMKHNFNNLSPEQKQLAIALMGQSAGGLIKGLV